MSVIYKMACVRDLTTKEALFGEIASIPVLRHLSNKMDEVVSRKELGQALRKTYAKDIGENADAPHFGFHSKKIHLPDGERPDPNILAHEAGHLELHKSLPGRAIQNIPMRAAFGMLPAAGLAGGAYTGYTNEMKDTSGGTLRDLGIGAGAAAPTMLSEGLASLKGRDLLKQHGATAQDLINYRKMVLPAFGTYAAAGPGAGLLNYGIGRALGSAAAKSRKKKKASPKNA